MTKQFLIFLSVLFLGSVFQSKAQTQVWTSNGANKIQQLTNGSVTDLISSGAVTPWGITVDVPGGVLYWTNVTEGTIRAADLDGSNVVTLLSGLDLPRGIALDEATNTLYWVEGGTDTPGLRSTVLTADPLIVTDIVTSDIVSPFHIALDTENQFIYWVDNATVQKSIKRVQYNGTGTETIISTVKQAAGLALDVPNNTLYWADFEDDIIYSADANATDQNIQTVSAITGGSTPWAIFFDEQSGGLYWTDYLNSTINEFDLSGSVNTELVSDVSTPSGFYGLSAQTNPDANNILYVDKNVAGGDGSGSSWANAIAEFRDALSWAANDWDGSDAPLQIWVADGTYLPTDVTTDRTATFQLVNNVEVYGGFAGGEANLGDRDWTANETILSGDISNDDLPFEPAIDSDSDSNTPTQTDHIVGDNSIHIVNGSGTGTSALLDGFTITAGLHSSTSFPNDSGAGVFNDSGSPTLSNLRIAGNRARYGGGMFNKNSSPVLMNLVFEANDAGQTGGGLYNETSSAPTLMNVVFTMNSAATGGGGILNSNSTPIFVGGIISSNSAGFTGGGMENNSSNTVLTNVTISKNSARDDGGGISNLSGSSTIMNNVIIWENTANDDPQVYNLGSSVNQSLIEGIDLTSTGTGNLDGTDSNNDPLFVDAAGGDYRLTEFSPAINAGDPATDLSLFPGGPDNPEDLAGNPRVFPGLIQTIDMGAYEFQGNVFGVVVPGDGNIVYVDKNVDTGAADYSASGNSWDDAVPELRDALTWAQGWDGDADGTLQIWVADGLYFPTDDDTDRTATFQLVNDVEIYGGFAGGEGSIDARDWVANLTILSGDIDGDDNPFDPDTDTDNDTNTPSQTDHIFGNNSFHVVTGSGTDATALFDGFSITGGQANSNGNANGGGMVNSGGSPTLSNVTFTGNTAGIVGSVSGGGGMFNGSSSPTLTNVTFNGNSSINSGGGMTNQQSSSPTLTNVTFTGNSANGGQGGGMYNTIVSSPTLINVTFTDNIAGSNGGGITLDANAELTNVTIAGNTAGSDGGGLWIFGSSPILTNVIIWGNTATNDGSQVYQDNSTLTLNYSIVQNGESGGIFNENGGTDTFGSGTGNIDADPLFADEAGGDYRLTEFSPAINAGSNAPFEPGGVAEGITTDLDGNDRKFGDTVDMGAYEFGAEPGVVPGGEDRRVLVSNASAFYTITAGDLSVNDAVSVVKIVTIAGGGMLELDGTTVADADVISSADISGGKLTWTPDAGEYGYGYASLSFRLVNEFDVESADEATLYIDLAATSVEFTAAAGAGWRFVTSPATGETIGSLLGPLWTQGFPGSDNPGASFANVQKLDQENYQWDPNVNATDEFTRGLGLIVYAYEDVDGAGGGFPLTLTSGQHWNELSEVFDYSALLDFTDQTPNESSFYLVANPHPIAVDFCEFVSSNVAVSVSLWDPQASGGNGDYTTLSCAVETTVPIAPFQSFWVRTTDANPSLSIPEAAYLETTTDGYFKDVENGLIASSTTAGNTAQAGPQASAGASRSDGYAVAFNVTSRDGIFSNTARLLFSGEATPELDTWDAPKLSPEGLASKWLSFYSLDEEGRPYAIQSLPTLTGDQTRIPLDIRTTQAGTFTLDWQLPESHQLSAGYFLRDNQSGEVIELTDGNSYRFEITQEQSSKTSNEVDEPATLNLEHQTVNAQNEPRFELLITTDGSDGFAGLGDLPSEFILNQNYPNPFNPTTIISYELPQASQVRLEVYDMAGRQVATLVSGQVAAGRHTVNFDASSLSSGVYLYRLQAGSSLQTRKLTILK